MKNSSFLIEYVSPKQLSNNDLNQIAAVEKDMWAS
jgi:hypothetical protein